MAPAVTVDVATSGITVSSTASVAFGGLNGYWGQLGSDSMESYCDAGPEYITISFVNSSPENEASGWPGTNFAGHCPGDYFYYTDSDGNSQRSDLWKNCYLMMEGIPYCQERGVKVLLSIGGEFTATSNYTVSTEANGIAFADWLYKAFGPKQDDYDGPRPFDATAWTTQIDGFDFDIEAELDNAPYVAMINRFRELDSSLVITGAPQCRLESQYFHMQEMVTNAKFDALFIQFYNNPYCDLLSDSGSGSDPVSNSNYDAWEEFLADTQSSAAKIFVGLPASSSAANSGYVDASVVQTLVQGLQGRSNFGGISLWDFTRGASNIDETTGSSFNQLVQNIVDYGTTIAPTTTTTTSSAPTTTSISTTTTSAPITTTTSTSIASTTSSTSSTWGETTSSTWDETTSSTSSSSSAWDETTSSYWGETTSSAWDETTTTSTSSVPTTTTSSSSTSIETTATGSETSTWESTTVSTATGTTSEGFTSTETTTGYELPTPTETTTDATDVVTSSTSTTEGSVTTTTDCTSEVETPETTSDCEEDIETSTTSGSGSSTVSASVTVETTASTSVEYTSETSGITLTASVPTTVETTESSTFLTTSAQSTFTPSQGPSSHSSFYPNQTYSISTTYSPSSATLPTSSYGDSVGTTTESASLTTSTVYTTHIYTVTQCPPEVTNCPSKGHYVTTEIIPLYTTVCPVAEEQPTPSATGESEAQVTKPAGSNSQPTNGGGKPKPTKEGNAGSTSEVKTLYETKIYTVTKCPPSVTNCPLNSVTTEVSSWTTTVAPAQTTPAGENGAVPQNSGSGYQPHETAAVPAAETTTAFISVVVVKPQLPQTSNYANATAHYSSPKPTTKLPVGGGAAPTGGCVGDECSTSSHSYTVPAATATQAPLTAGASSLCAGLTLVLAAAGFQMLI